MNACANAKWKPTRTRRHVTRHKTMIIPYIPSASAQVKYVMFRDTRSKEWTFACGGKKLRETEVECGNRELCEESNGIFRNVLRKGDIPEWVFFTTERTKEEKRKDTKDCIVVTMKYTVYFVEVPDLDYPSMFHNSSFKNDETDDCILVPKGKKGTEVTAGSIETLNVWSFMKNEVIKYL